MNFYFDLDGVLSIYERDAYCGPNPKWSELGGHYYRNVHPDMRMIELFNSLKAIQNKKNKDFKDLIVDDIRVISTLPHESRLFVEQYKDKSIWLEKHCDDFDSAKDFKATIHTKPHLVEHLNDQPLGLNDVLIDDYNPNLEAWQTAGGTAIKYLNGINSGTSFAGFHIQRSLALDEILNFLEMLSKILNYK